MNSANDMQLIKIFFATSREATLKKNLLYYFQCLFFSTLNIVDPVFHKQNKAM